MAELAVPIFRSTDEFLAWEERQAERYEFVGGVLRLMSGGTANHDLVGMNIGGALWAALRGGPRFVHGSNLKIRSPDGAAMYPDVFVRCGENRGEAQVVEDPVLVVGVLSPSTQRDDLTLKRWAYQEIPTLQAILFVSAQTAAIELAEREPGRQLALAPLSRAECRGATGHARDRVALGRGLYGRRSRRWVTEWEALRSARQISPSATPLPVPREHLRRQWCRARLRVGRSHGSNARESFAAGRSREKKRPPGMSPEGHSWKGRAPQLLSWRFSAELLPFLPRTSS